MENKTEEIYDEESDLGAIIDERLQIGIMGGKTSASRMALNTLVSLLIDKGVITASEYNEKLKANERKTLKAIKK